MGLFGPKESQQEINQRIRNSEAGVMVADMLCGFFQAGESHIQWLMQNSKERFYKLEVYKQGVQLKRVEVNRVRLKETGSYDVDAEAWGFGASGYEDLPNGRYASALKDYICEQMAQRCPSISVFYSDGTCIKLAENVKKGW